MAANTTRYTNEPRIRFRDIYKPTSAVDDYKDAYSLERGANLAYRLQQIYPDLPDHVAVGVAANALHESYGNPAVRQGQNPDATGPVKGGATGLFGWDSVRAQKLRELYGNKWNTLDNQLKYFQMENSGPEKKNWGRVLQTKTPEEATQTFATYWERPGVPALDKRTGLARNLYNYIEQLKANAAQTLKQNDVDLALSQSNKPLDFLQAVKISPVIGLNQILSDPVGRYIVDAINGLKK